MLTRGGTRAKRNLFARSPAYLQQLGLDKNSNTFAAKNAPYLLRDVDILTSQELRTRLDDGHIAAEATISLCLSIGPTAFVSVGTFLAIRHLIGLSE